MLFLKLARGLAACAANSRPIYWLAADALLGSCTALLVAFNPRALTTGAGKCRWTCFWPLVRRTSLDCMTGLGMHRLAVVGACDEN